MLKLDRYWSLDICIDCSKRFTVDSLNTISWFIPFTLCCHPRYIFQVICLHHIIECRLHNNGVFVMVVKQPKYKGDVASFVALPCWFYNPLLHNSFCLIVYPLVIKINFIECWFHCLCWSRAFRHCFLFQWEYWLEGLFWLVRHDQKIDEMFIGIFIYLYNKSLITFFCFYCMVEVESSLSEYYINMIGLLAKFVRASNLFKIVLIYFGKV